jgi:hypothetical protein
MASSPNAPESAFAAKEYAVNDSGNIEDNKDEDFSLDEFKEKNA